MRAKKGRASQDLLLMAGRGNAKMRGQASQDLLLSAALGLAMVMALFTFSILQGFDSTRLSAAQDSVNKIAKRADILYSIGPGSKDVVEFNLPEGLDNVEISGKRVLISMKMSSGTTDIYAYASANLSGFVNNESGWQKASIYVNDSGIVQISPTS